MEDLIIIEEDLLIEEVVLVLEAAEVVAEILTESTVNCVASLATLQISAIIGLIGIFKECLIIVMADHKKVTGIVLNWMLVLMVLNWMLMLMWPPLVTLMELS